MVRVCDQVSEPLAARNIATIAANEAAAAAKPIKVRGSVISSLPTRGKDQGISSLLNRASAEKQAAVQASRRLGPSVLRLISSSVEVLAIVAKSGAEQGLCCHGQGPAGI